jgi:hypothetical protein
MGRTYARPVLHAEEIKAHGTGFRALGPNAMANWFLGILRHQALQFGLGVFMFEQAKTAANPALTKGPLGRMRELVNRSVSRPVSLSSSKTYARASAILINELDAC